MSDPNAPLPSSNKKFFSKPVIALIGALIGSAMIGFSPIFVRVSEVGPTATAFYRFFFSLPILWGWMIADHSKRGTLTKHPTCLSEYMLLLSAGLFLAGDIALWHWSLTLTSVVNAGILNNLTSIFVALSAWLFLGERLNRLTVFGIILAVVGSVILVGKNFTLGSKGLAGDVLALASAFFYTGYIIAVKRLRYFFSTPTIMSWGGLATLYVFAFLSFFSGDTLFPHSPSGWITLMGLALVVHIGGQGLMSYSIGHLSATFSGLTLLVGPVTSAAMAWIFLGESLGFLQIVGSGIVLTGILIARQVRIKEKE